MVVPKDPKGKGRALAEEDGEWSLGDNVLSSDLETDEEQSESVSV